MPVRYPAPLRPGDRIAVTAPSAGVLEDLRPRLDVGIALAGTAYGDLGAFAAAHAPEGLIVYLEAAEEKATSIARHLWRVRLAGRFDQPEAVLIGRTRAPDSSGLSQRDAVRSALGDLPVPVVLDADCGHVPPHLALVNGAITEVVVSPAGNTVTQHLS